MPPVSVILTAAHEERTIGRALDTLLPQLTGDDEVLIVCPDDSTARAATTQMAVEATRRRTAMPGVRVIHDEGRGKPAALNLAMAEARHDTLVLTDGDVVVEPGAIAPLLAPFAEPGVGATSGHPVPIDRRDTMLGYWAHLLTEAGAHARRMQRDRQGAYLECSGYLYAVKHSLLDPLPEEALAEDGLISRMVWQRGARIRYAARRWCLSSIPRPTAIGYARRCAVLVDMHSVCRQTAGASARRPARGRARGRSFWEEVRGGTLSAWSYPRTRRERWWTLLLFAGPPACVATDPMAG